MPRKIVLFLNHAEMGSFSEELKLFTRFFSSIPRNLMGGGLVFFYITFFGVVGGHRLRVKC